MSSIVFKREGTLGTRVAPGRNSFRAYAPVASGGGTGSFFQNQPVSAGWAQQVDESFSILEPSPWRFDRKGFGEPVNSIIQTTDVTAPYSGPNILRGYFPVDFVGGSSPFNYGLDLPTPVKKLYLSIIIKWSNPFNNANQNAGTKFIWVEGDEIQGGCTYLSTAPGGNGAGSLDTESHMFFSCNQQGGAVLPGDPDPETNTNRSLNPNVAGNESVANLEQYIGSWIEIEVLVEANTSNTTFDGKFDAWINGTHTHHHTDVAWQMDNANTGNRRWLGLNYEPTYGGGEHIVPQDQWHYVDHVRIAGSNT